MRRSWQGFTERGACVLAVSPAEGDATAAVCHMLNAPYLCLGDPSGEGYDAFGLERRRVRQIINFRTIWRGIAAFLHGYRQGKTLGDRERLPGAFIIDARGVIRWAWKGRDAADHARAMELFAALDAIREG